MGEVGVHLDDQPCAAGQRCAEAGDVGRSEPFLRRPVQAVDRIVFPAEPRGDLTGPIGRVVVDDQDLGGGG